MVKLTQCLVVGVLGLSECALFGGYPFRQHFGVIQYRATAGTDTIKLSKQRKELPSGAVGAFKRQTANQTRALRGRQRTVSCAGNNEILRQSAVTAEKKAPPRPWGPFDSPRRSTLT
jgi:hypothetical protein